MLEIFLAKASGLLANTAMARFKQIVGAQLQAREWKPQQIEVQIGCALLNRFTHLGMPQTYKIEK